MKINGRTIATPSEIKLTIQDLDSDSYRNLNGKLIRDRIAVKRKLECSWNALTQSQASALLGSVTSTFFTLTYPDALLGTTSGTFYVGDRTAPIYTLSGGTPL